MIESGNYTIPSALPAPASPLSWDTPLSSIIPDDFVLGPSDAWATSHITLEDALSHRTGMPRHDRAGSHIRRDDTPGTNATRRKASVRDGTRLLRHLPTNAAPRTKWQYCNHMFVAASHAVQTLVGGRRGGSEETDVWLGDLLREWLWEPLGMRSTYFSLEDALAAGEKEEEGKHRLASGYAWDRHAEQFGPEVPFMPTDEIGGAGAIMSNVEDYSRWIRMLLREEGPLPREGHRAVRTPRIIMNPEGWAAVEEEEDAGSPPYDAPMAYALGWQTSSYRGHRFWTHSGGMHAYGAEVFFYPDLDLGMVVLGNTAITSNGLARKLIWDMVDDRLGVPVGERYDWGADMKSYQENLEAAIDTSIDRFYPDRPEQPIPPTLPLKAYEGTYFHPGYLNFTLQPTSAHEGLITRENISLVAVRADMTWPTVNQFQHVSGEYWMNFEHLRDSPHGETLKGYSLVQFVVGPDGHVDRMGITWVQASPNGRDVIEGLVWFDKIE
ncbi:beta-lactamase/transpeptidase-like protein [Cryphonectria parasitica EP155]|uniref:Beta-lactamase/transpeptidase-like protein n=1 Tax=Cryphonectria parasitica (strain ATCC 38755 / EP155) TaxID=660469 RepID=A0A9P4XVR4_CRYP1|nr:beta-lactamase/transpeptidase-like protein [Cryphonectria parasitica EP155]KAF3761893.1 beta-lactamase/transpeptidase-like protein [Cryphonectria parasitica EP155]